METMGNSTNIVPYDGNKHDSISEKGTGAEVIEKGATDDVMAIIASPNKEPAGYRKQTRLRNKALKLYSKLPMKDAKEMSSEGTNTSFWITSKTFYTDWKHVTIL